MNTNPADTKTLKAQDMIAGQLYIRSKLPGVASIAAYALSHMYSPDLTDEEYSKAFPEIDIFKGGTYKYPPDTKLLYLKPCLLSRTIYGLFLATDIEANQRIVCIAFDHLVLYQTPTCSEKQHVIRIG
jgi:hypothetical protein